MKKRSEGVRRIVLVCSFLAVIGWILYVAIESHGFRRREMAGDGWFVFIAGMPITFFIPQVIAKAIYWIRDGFSQDK